MAATEAPGWYGKLPSLGDFASRRLTPLFVEPWDRWLAMGLASWRDSDERWLDAFLAAPTIRFALGTGVPFDGSPGYTGVLMPSVDRVGRYFPLTVVRPRAFCEAEAPSNWLDAVENVAVTALQDDWDAERLDEALAGLEAEDDHGPAWPDDGGTIWWQTRHGAASTPMVFAGLPGDAELPKLFAARARDHDDGSPLRELKIEDFEPRGQP